MNQPRIHYIDNIKILLATFVIIVHVLIGYTFEDTPYFIREEEKLLTCELQYFYYFCRVFLMEIFYYIAGFFLCRSLEKYSTYDVLKNRLLRYGVPILICQFVVMLSPSSDVPGTWYLEILLIFTFITLILHKRSVNYIIKIRLSLPGIFTGGLIISLLLGITRYFFGMGFSIILPFVHIEPGQILKYAVFMYMGMLSYKNKWVDDLLSSTKNFFLLITSTLCIIGWGICCRSECLNDLTSFKYAFIDGFQGITICYTILIVFKKYLNRTNNFLSQLSKQIMGVYLINPFYIYLIQYFVCYTNVNIVFKAIIVFTGSAFLTIATTRLMWKVPFMRRVL